MVDGHLMVWKTSPKHFNGQPAPEAGHKRVLGMASPDHQVGALFEALDEGVLMAPSKSIGYFFAISSCPEVRCTFAAIGSAIGEFKWFNCILPFVSYSALPN